MVRWVLNVGLSGARLELNENVVVGELVAQLERSPKLLRELQQIQLALLFGELHHGVFGVAQVPEVSTLDLERGADGVPLLLLQLLE